MEFPKETQKSRLDLLHVRSPILKCPRKVGSCTQHTIGRMNCAGTEQMVISRFRGNLATGGYSIDTALDPVRNLLAIAHDIADTVEIFALERPSMPGAPVSPPVLKATIETGEYTPRVLAMDSIRGRLFVAATQVVEEGTLNSMWLLIYDLNDDSPVLVAEPFEIPVTTTMDVDPYAGVLGLVDLNSDTLNLYNILGSVPGEIPGVPLNLRNLYPQSNSTGFQVRGLVVRPPQRKNPCCTRSVCTFGSHRPELSDCDWKRGRVPAAVQYV